MGARIIHRGAPCGGVVVRCDGNVTGRELIEVNDLVSTEQAYRYQLWDFSDADSIEVSFEEIHKLAIQDSSIPRDCDLQAVLIVGTQTGLANLADTYETFSLKWVGRQRHYRTEMLTSLPEAREWLRNQLGITEFD